MSKEKIEYDIDDLPMANSWKRGVAFFLDASLVAMLRIVLSKILVVLWYKNSVENFVSDMVATFGEKALEQPTQEHIQFFFDSPLFMHTILLYALIIAIGALYHGALNSSSWSATLGKRVMGICVLNSNNLAPLSVFRAVIRYFVGFLPWIGVFYLASYQIYSQSSFVGTIKASGFNMIVAAIIFIWFEIYFFSKNKTAHDFICKTLVIDGSFGSAFPGWKRADREDAGDIAQSLLDDNEADNEQRIEPSVSISSKTTASTASKKASAVSKKPAGKVSAGKTAAGKAAKSGASKKSAVSANKAASKSKTASKSGAKPKAAAKKTTKSGTKKKTTKKKSD